MKILKKNKSQKKNQGIILYSTRINLTNLPLMTWDPDKKK
jgi:hypothetical protein